jgi:hypothetical protein
MVAVGYGRGEAPTGRASPSRFLELCVFTQMMWDLTSGGAAIEVSREYADYRDQLISEDEAARMTAAYERVTGISIDAQRFVSAFGEQWNSERA